MVSASIPAYLFEVGSTARFGLTLGKRLADIRVVPWDGEAAAVGDQARLAHWRSGARWAIPHVTGIVAAVVAAIVALPGVQDAGDFWGPVAALRPRRSLTREGGSPTTAPFVSRVTVVPDRFNDTRDGHGGSYP